MPKNIPVIVRIAVCPRAINKQSMLVTIDQGRDQRAIFRCNKSVLPQSPITDTVDETISINPGPLHVLSFSFDWRGNATEKLNIGAANNDSQRPKRPVLLDHAPKKQLKGIKEPSPSRRFAIPSTVLSSCPRLLRQDLLHARRHGAAVSQPCRQLHQSFLAAPHPPSSTRTGCLPTTGPVGRPRSRPRP